MDVSAATIGLLYQHRWQVELFFRWYKSFGHFGHLISHSREGVLTHLYVTIIAVLLIYLHTGYRPSKDLFALLSQVAAGGATLDEILPILRERERRNELDRVSAARHRAKNRAKQRQGRGGRIANPEPPHALSKPAFTAVLHNACTTSLSRPRCT